MFWMAVNRLMEVSLGSFMMNFLACLSVLSFMTEHYILLLIYISYYSIAYTIKLLEAKLVMNTRSNPSVPFWNGIKEVLLHIHRANAALGSVFSLPVLYMITTKLAMASLSLFIIIYGLVKPNALLSSNSMAIMLLIELSKSVLGVFIILNSADLPVNQV